MQIFSNKMTKHCVSEQAPCTIKGVMSIRLGGEKVYKHAFEKFQLVVKNIHMN